MKVVTYNIRGDFGVDGKNDFCFRKPLILEKLAKEKPDIIGFQEVLPHVAAWMREALPEYDVVGCGREKDLTGEQMTVIFRRDKFQMISMQTFWLSPTPNVPGSRYAEQRWCPRTATDLVLREAATGKVLRVVNTHLDMTHTGVTVIEFKEEFGYAQPRISMLSSDAHLYREGLTTNYKNFFII